MSADILADARRIFSRVNFTDDCWLYEGYVHNTGYGRACTGSVRTGNYRSDTLLHRWVYEYIVGPIPEGLHIDHLCQVRHCLNPAHLEPVPHEVNISRMRNRRVPQDYCGKGIHLMALHARETKFGKRFCVPCVREQRARAYQRRKAAA